MRATLTLTIGIPGSGKTTWAKTQAATLLSTDINRTDRSVNWLALQGQLRARAERLLRAGESVIVDACATKADNRRAWLDVAQRAGALTRLAILDVAMPVALVRNGQRGAEAVPLVRMQAYAGEMAASLLVVDGEGWGEVVRVDAGATEEAGRAKEVASQ